MLLIENNTTYLDFTRNNYFCNCYTSAGTFTSGSTVLSGDTIYSQLIITNKLSKEVKTYNNTTTDNYGPRFFRLIIDLTSLDKGTYSYQLKLTNFTTLVIDSYEVGILIREFKNDQESYTYDNNENDYNYIYIYKK